MAALIWLRRIVIVLLLAIFLLMLLGVYVLVDALLRVALVGGAGCLVPLCLWLDRKLTSKLRLHVLAIRLESSGERSPAALPADRE